MNDEGWNLARDGLNQINLIEAYEIENFGVTPSNEAQRYAMEISAIWPIKSRQLAAVILANMKRM